MKLELQLFPDDPFDNPGSDPSSDAEAAEALGLRDGQPQAGAGGDQGGQQQGSPADSAGGQPGQATDGQADPSTDSEGQPAGGQQGEGERLIAGRFRSMAELVTSWQEAQATIGRQGNEIGQLRRENQAYRQLIDRVYGGGEAQEPTTPQPAQPVPGQQQGAAQGPAYGTVEWWSAFLRSPDQAIAQLVEQRVAQVLDARLSSHPALAKREVLDELADAQQRLPHFKELEPVMAEVFRENPWLMERPGRFDLAYQMARGKVADFLAESARRTGQEEAEQAAQNRRPAQVTAGAARGGGDKPAPGSDEAIIAEIFAAGDPNDPFEG